jgi:hypothetical protein
MRHVIAAATSPLNCRWIKPGTRAAFEAFEYAVCGRHGDAERVVNEAECTYCPAWERPVDHFAAVRVTSRPTSASAICTAPRSGPALS